MKKATKIWLITAAVLVVAGIIIFGVAMTMLKWDFLRLSTVKYETNIYDISEAFEDISIKGDVADITFLPSEDGKTSVECIEREKVKHSVSVKDGVLVVESVDDITIKQSFAIGVFQMLAIIPGTSRSGSTILGSMLIGLSRETVYMVSVNAKGCVVACDMIGEGTTLTCQKCGKEYELDEYGALLAKKVTNIEKYPPLAEDGWSEQAYSLAK